MPPRLILSQDRVFVDPKWNLGGFKNRENAFGESYRNGKQKSSKGNLTVPLHAKFVVFVFLKVRMEREIQMKCCKYRYGILRVCVIIPRRSAIPIDTTNIFNVVTPLTQDLSSDFFCVNGESQYCQKAEACSWRNVKGVLPLKWTDRSVSQCLSRTSLRKCNIPQISTHDWIAWTIFNFRFLFTVLVWSMTSRESVLESVRCAKGCPGRPI